MQEAKNISHTHISESQQPIALLSVYNKTGLVPFAKALVEEHGFKLLSTGGTARALREAGLAVTDVSQHTGFPEMMEGRVKTLHPKVHGGLLARWENPAHVQAAQENGIVPISLVCVNLYPFEDTVAQPGCTQAEAIEQIDIGGPSMLRSAAKNALHTTVVVEVADYEGVLSALAEAKSGEGKPLETLRRRLAQKVFATTSAYDGAIAQYLQQQHLACPDMAEEPSMDDVLGLPSTFNLSLPKAQSLRYGENPHQHAALYGDFLSMFTQLQGKELSYNNLLDVSAATYLIGEFEAPTCAILKHTNPCGVASAPTLMQAWHAAFATDTQAPFGGIIVVNQTMEGDLASTLAGLFCEVIIAPDFSPEALAIFSKKKNLRLLKVNGTLGAETLQEVRSVPGGVLVQDRDQKKLRPGNYQVVTNRAPTAQELDAMLFGWRVVKHVKSNAIVYAGCTEGISNTLGIGAGQMSRIDSSQIAVWKAGQANLNLAGSVVASDAFFPFPDGLVAAAKAGATAAIQPGGSVKDAEVIEAANAHNMAMVFTGVRHFKH